MLPAMIKQLVMTNCKNINVRILAMVSASLSDLPDFSPSALAQILHKFFTLIFYMPCQKLSVTGCKFLDRKYNPRLHTNQFIFTTQVCLQRYFLLLCTMNIFLSFIVVSGERGLTLRNCSRPNAITNPIA